MQDDQYGQQDVDNTHDFRVHEAVGQASNLGMGDHIPQEAATGFRGHGGDPIQDISGGEVHGDSMNSKNVARKAHAAHWTHEEDE